MKTELYTVAITNSYLPVIDTSDISFKTFMLFLVVLQQEKVSYNGNSKFVQFQTTKLFYELDYFYSRVTVAFGCIVVKNLQYDIMWIR